MYIYSVLHKTAADRRLSTKACTPEQPPHTPPVATGATIAGCGGGVGGEASRPPACWAAPVCCLPSVSKVARAAVDKGCQLVLPATECCLTCSQCKRCV